MTHVPVRYHGVMISSTFTDLKEHRQALIKALNDHGLMHVSMENLPALADAEAIESSYRMVRDASAYILLIGRRYGDTPVSVERNPEMVSITELEFAEASRLGRPMLLFLMSDGHLVRESDIELSPEKRTKLGAFREKAITWNAQSSLQRVYSTFDSLEEFKDKVGPAVARLKQALDSTHDPPTTPSPTLLLEGPRPPQLYKNSPYLASHPFVGREDQLRTLDEWAQQSDAHPVLLFEAIGGSGKSILTWNWLVNRSVEARADWAGRFWYSFYERGAETRDFLIQALSYMTGQPYQRLVKTEGDDLSEQLLRQLRTRPWLLILDGIERLLVHYHRFDAAHADDGEAGTEDRIGRRHPLATIRDEDSDLFRSFLTAAPSKLLITSRLTPRCLVNAAHQPLPGLLHQRLPGLHPEDAELLFRSCGVYGDSRAIRSYLKENCDCHPLVIGFLAGLVNWHHPDRGNFDIWVRAQSGGLALNLAEVDLVQRRNHILRAAVEALSDSSRELLATLAMVSSGFDYRVLVALSPMASAGAETSGESSVEAGLTPAKNLVQPPTGRRRDQNRAGFLLHNEESNDATGNSTGGHRPPRLDLQATVTDLEERGLLLFDKQKRLYDLHPVVRGVVVGGLDLLERERLGGRIIDYFSTASARSLNQAETLEDVQPALNVVHTYLAMGQLEKAWTYFHPELSTVLRLNFEAYEKNLAILRPFFAGDWSTLKEDVPDHHAGALFNCAGINLGHLDLHQEALCSHMAAHVINLKANNWKNALLEMINIAATTERSRRLALTDRILRLCIAFSEVICADDMLFLSHLESMRLAAIVGDRGISDDHWNQLDPLGRDWPLALYRPGEAEAERLACQLHHDHLIEADLEAAERVAASSRASRRVQRRLHRLRGEWRLSGKHFTLAAISLEAAGRMARACGLRDAEAEALLARARHLEGTLPDPRGEAERLSAERDRSELHLAFLWEAIGDQRRALGHAQSAFEQACADGAPYVYRQDLALARMLIRRLHGEEPECRSHDPARKQKVLFPGSVEPEPWLNEVEAIIERLRVENKDAIERHSRLSPEDRRIASKGHLIHKLKAKDTTGRWAYYFVLVDPSREEEFLGAMNGGGIMDLEDYGKVVASCYGEAPSEEVKDFLREKYGFEI